MVRTLKATVTKNQPNWLDPLERGKALVLDKIGSSVSPDRAHVGNIWLCQVQQTTKRIITRLRCRCVFNHCLPIHVIMVTKWGLSVHSTHSPKEIIPTLLGPCKSPNRLDSRLHKRVPKDYPLGYSFLCLSVRICFLFY